MIPARISNSPPTNSPLSLSLPPPRLPAPNKTRYTRTRVIWKKSLKLLLGGKKNRVRSFFPLPISIYRESYAEWMSKWCLTERSLRIKKVRSPPLPPPQERGGKRWRKGRLSFQPGFYHIRVRTARRRNCRKRWQKENKWENRKCLLIVVVNFCGKTKKWKNLIFFLVGVGFTKEGQKHFWVAFKPPHILFGMLMHVTSVKTQKSIN